MRALPLLLCLVMPAAGAQTLTGRVIGIADGDTLTVVDAAKTRHRVRLASIDAPEIGQNYGKRSRTSLSQLCWRKPVRVEIQEHDGGRAVGQVECGGVDAGAEQVKRGMAWVSARYTSPGSPLFEYEAHARLTQAGLWAGKNPIPPWQWRAREKAKAPPP